MQNLAHYFSTAQERYKIKLRRFEDKNPPPWTSDPVFKEWSFCNVFREDDVTTKWFRENIRDHTKGLHAIRATVTFRWFNRISTGEILKDIILEDRWDAQEVLRRLKALPPDQPVFTGAYMIKSFNGKPKTESIIQNVDDALRMLPELTKSWGRSLEEATMDLTTIPFLGPFMGYEVVTDLRHTDVLCNAQDIMTWANTGPGCKHGLGRIFNGNPRAFTDPGALSANARAFKMLMMMRDIVDASRDESYWPLDYPKWEMREAEHWACEYDKYCRGASGEKLKRRFVPQSKEDIYEVNNARH